MNLVRKIFAGFTSMAMIMMMVAPVATAADYEDMDTSDLIAVIQSLQATIESLQAQLGDTEEETTTGGAIEGIPEDFTFDQALSSGMSNQDVEYLQIVLNSDSDTQLAESGVGSPGNETQYFGSLTTAGVIAFQEKYSEDVLAPYGLTEGTGYVGETTRQKLNELLQTSSEEDTSEAEYGKAADITVTGGVDQFGGITVELEDENGDSFCTASFVASEDLSASEAASELESAFSCSAVNTSREGEVVTVTSDNTFKVVISGNAEA